MILLTLLTVLSLTIAATTAKTQINEDDVSKLMEDYFSWRVDMFPVTASRIGVHKNDMEVADNSLDGFKNIEEGCERFNTMAERMRDSSDDDDDDNLSKLYKHFLQLTIDNSGICAQNMKLRAYLMAGPAFIEGVQSYVPQWFGDTKSFDLENLKDYDIVLQRLRKVPKFVTNVIDLLKEGVRQKITMALPPLVRTMKQFEKLLFIPPNESDFFTLFKGLNETYSSEKQPSEHVFASTLMDDAMDIIKTKIMPAFRKLQENVHYCI